jgi:predicted double-glycine peptidase
MKRLLTSLVLAVACVAPAAANESAGALIGPAGFAPHLQVKSVRERRFENVVQQETDFSCGAAVLATLFRDAYGANVGESDVLKGMLNVANPELVRERGFALLDLKTYAHVIWLSAEGYHVALDALRAMRVPAIVLLDMSGYHHFALLKKVDERYAYIADPALGNRVEPLPQFTSMWNGIVLVVLGPGYRPDNVLRDVTPPLGAGQLYASAPTEVTPQAINVLMFTGVKEAQRL